MTLSLVILSLFAIGLQQISYKLYSSLFNFKTIEKQNSIYSLGIIITFIGVLNFSSFTNFILIIPTILFKKLNPNLTDILLKRIDNLLIILLFIILIYGVISLFQLLHILINNNYKLIDDFKIKSLLILLSSLFVSCIIYLALAPKDINTGIAYDTGLYHLPFVNYISTFGIETGMASMQWNYGFYSLQFFGQSVFQQLYGNPNFLSPSLNIVFFGLYMSYFVSNFFIYPKDFITNKNETNKIYNPFFFRIFTSLYFFSSILLTSEGLLRSLSSYSQNIGIFCCASIVCFIFLSSTFIKLTKYELLGIFLLTFYAPLFKGSGIIVGFLAILILLFHILISKNLKFITTYINEKKLFSKRNYLLIIFLIIFSYSIALITNTLTSGYPLFPSPLIGPLGQHSVEKIDVIHAKELIINLARFGPSYLQNDNLLIENNSLFNWFPLFINSRNGAYFIVSTILPTFISIVISLFSTKEKFRNFKINNLLIFSTALFVIEFICMIFLVPELRYYSWFAPVSIFLFFYSTIYFISFKRDKLIKIGVLNYLFFLISYLIFIWPLSITNSTILKNIPNSFFRTPILSKVETKLYKMPITKWLPIKTSSDKYKIIRVPVNSDQCWGSEPPCTPYLKEGMPLTIRKMYKK